jgi:hypothetical protein
MWTWTWSKTSESYIELYFRQTQQYTNELSHTTYPLEFIGKIVQLRYMFRFIEPSSGATLTISYYWICTFMDRCLYSRPFAVICTDYMLHNRTHSIKIINASHASSIYRYMNTKLKLLNCNANIYFNRKCLEFSLTPKYAQTKIKIKMNPHDKKE